MPLLIAKVDSKYLNGYSISVYTKPCFKSRRSKNSWYWRIYCSVSDFCVWIIKVTAGLTFFIVVTIIVRYSCFFCLTLVRIFLFDLFYGSGLFLYPLKTSENQRFFDIFRGYRKRAESWNGLIVTSQWSNLCIGLCLSELGTVSPI